jgi:hypothetical protein
VTAIIIALLTAFGGLGVWFFKLILIERYQFMDKIGDEPIKNPYVMIRLDRLSGAVDAFNWAGWVASAPPGHIRERAQSPSGGRFSVKCQGCLGPKR